MASYWLFEPDKHGPTIRLTKFSLGSNKTDVCVADWVIGLFRAEAPVAAGD